MTLEELTATLNQLFDSTVQTLAPGSFQIETPQYRLLVLLSDDESWLRVLLPISPAQDAQPFLEELLEANFDLTQETRYAVHQNVLWSVFQHSMASLTADDLGTAIERMLMIKEQGLDDTFSNLAEKQIRQIIQASKRQGQSLETTMQTLDRFYQEGLLGDLEMGKRSREETISAWQRQLERLWSEVEP
ncbi:hypothetical protein [Myxacorys almedinensis]|uniref:Uncharacterized protein n=1 Tax=Myxacorys almedinensis A TaxID=2690445 RepID=A0A8J7YYA9_9CYAN|nr:hypothetical protein [Myxacorys almedinensis]NDJ16769.1 hypothetical protein [Myxacorys almedinensis A]